MATATLKPTNVYQLTYANGNHIITSKNPQNLILGFKDNTLNRVLLEFDINESLPYYYKILTKNYFRFSYFNESQDFSRIYATAFQITIDNQSLEVGNQFRYSPLAMVSRDTFSTQYKYTDPPYYKNYGKAIPDNAEGISEKNISGLVENKFYIMFTLTFYGAARYWASVTNDFTMYLHYLETSVTSNILLNPSNSFLDRTKANVFNLSVNPDLKTFHVLDISSGTYHYKLSSASTYISVNFSGSSFTIPANTLANNSQYNIYATAVTSSGASSDTSVGDYTTVDVKGEVTAISPKNVVTQGNINFNWDYSAPTGTQQFAYDLDISYDNGTTWENIANHVVSSNPTSNQTITTSGTIYWRVRGYNQSNIPSDYSEATMFLNAMPPRTPVFLNVESGSAPIITWNAEGQTAYQFQVIDESCNVFLDTGFLYTSDNIYRFSKYLPNGVYTFKLRTMNTYEQVSEFATYNYLQNVQITVPMVNYTINNQGIMLSVDSSEGFEHIYIKRNNVTLGEFSNNSFLDRFAKVGMNEYTIIFVTGNNEAGFTNINIEFTPSIKTESLIDLEGNIININKRWNARLQPQRRVISDSESINYLGASVPEINTTDLVIRTFDVSVYDQKNEYDNLIGKTLFYRGLSASAWVVVTALSRTDTWFGNEVNLSLEETQYSEAVEYEI